MSEDENSPSAAVGKKCQGALQLGPQKKPYVTGRIAFALILTMIWFD